MRLFVCSVPDGSAKPSRDVCSFDGVVVFIRVKESGLVAPSYTFFYHLHSFQPPSTYLPLANHLILHSSDFAVEIKFYCFYIFGNNFRQL